MNMKTVLLLFSLTVATVLTDLLKEKLLQTHESLTYRKPLVRGVKRSIGNKNATKTEIKETRKSVVTTPSVTIRKNVTDGVKGHSLDKINREISASNKTTPIAKNVTISVKKNLSHKIEGSSINNNHSGTHKLKETTSPIVIIQNVAKNERYTSSENIDEDDQIEEETKDDIIDKTRKVIDNRKPDISKKKMKYVYIPGLIEVDVSKKKHKSKRNKAERKKNNQYDKKEETKAGKRKIKRKLTMKKLMDIEDTTTQTERMVTEAASTLDSLATEKYSTTKTVEVTKVTGKRKISRCCNTKIIHTFYDMDSKHREECQNITNIENMDTENELEYKACFAQCIARKKGYRTRKGHLFLPEMMESLENVLHSLTWLTKASLDTIVNTCYERGHLQSRNKLGCHTGELKLLNCIVDLLQYECYENYIHKEENCFDKTIDNLYHKCRAPSQGYGCHAIRNFLHHS